MIVNFSFKDTGLAVRQTVDGQGEGVRAVGTGNTQDRETLINSHEAGDQIRSFLQVGHHHLRLHVLGRLLEPFHVPLDLPDLNVLIIDDPFKKHVPLIGLNRFLPKAIDDFVRVDGTTRPLFKYYRSLLAQFIAPF